MPWLSQNFENEAIGFMIIFKWAPKVPDFQECNGQFLQLSDYIPSLTLQCFHLLVIATDDEPEGIKKEATESFTCLKIKPNICLRFQIFR